MTKPLMVILVGLPTSGKNFAGRYIQAEFGIPFYPSLATTHPGTTHLPWDRPTNYDEELLVGQLEQDEDIEALSLKSNCVVIEGWHIGNYAYAALRAPHLIDRYRGVLFRWLVKFEIRLFYFSRTPEELVEYWNELLSVDVARVIKWYHSWLDELAKITKDYPIPEFNLYSDWPPQDAFFTKRIRYLLTQELKIIGRNSG